jgi:hypothetical protein
MVVTKMCVAEPAVLRFFSPSPHPRSRPLYEKLELIVEKEEQTTIDEADKISFLSCHDDHDSKRNRYAFR